MPFTPIMQNSSNIFLLIASEYGQKMCVLLLITRAGSFINFSKLSTNNNNLTFTKFLG